MSRARLTIGRLMLVVGLLALPLVCLRIVGVALVFAIAPALVIGLAGSVLTDGRGRVGRFFIGATIGGLLAAFVVISPIGAAYQTYQTSVTRFVRRVAPDMGVPIDNVPISSIPPADRVPGPSVLTTTTLIQPGPIASMMMLAGLVLPSLAVALIGGLAALAVTAKYPPPSHSISMIS